MSRPLILLVLMLAGCGVDGPPLRPGTDQPGTVRPGLSIGGTAALGVQKG